MKTTFGVDMPSGHWCHQIDSAVGLTRPQSARDKKKKENLNLRSVPEDIFLITLGTRRKIWSSYVQIINRLALQKRKKQINGEFRRRLMSGSCSRLKKNKQKKTVLHCAILFHALFSVRTLDNRDITC